MEKGKTEGANKVNEHKGFEIGMEKWPAIGFFTALGTNSEEDCFLSYGLGKILIALASS